MTNELVDVDIGGVEELTSPLSDTHKPASNMLLLRTMPKLGTVVMLGFLIPGLMAVTVFIYANRYMDVFFQQLDALEDDDTRGAPIGNGGQFVSSFAYQKQQELESLDEEEEQAGGGVPEYDIRPIETLSYRDCLKQSSDQYGVVLLKFCEEGRIDSAINFHETSVVANQINNILYISADPRVCRELWKLEIRCHVIGEEYMTHSTNESVSVEDAEKNKGKRKAIARIKLILKALTAGHTVLFTDLNTLYLRNPFDNIECGSSCDLALSVDNISSNFANWALHYAKPRRGVVYMYARMLTILGAIPITSSKDILNRVISEMTSKEELDVKYLNPETFSPASLFFLVRRFADENTKCRTCVAVFEDRGISKQDQIYQLKELHLWNANFDEYYSSRQRQYMLYHNTYLYGERRSLMQELLALRNALAISQILGRILILPRFHCPGSLFENKYCGLGDLVKMTYFDEVFQDTYREHSFMDHPKVSREVRREVTYPHFLGAELLKDVDNDPAIKQSRTKIIYIPPKSPKGLTAEEIHTYFKNEASYNLLFHSLYENFAGFEDMKKTKEFNTKLKRAFKFTSPINVVLGDIVRTFDFPV